MNKEEIIKVIDRHMKPKDVGIAMLVCISEPEQIERLAEELAQLILLRVSGSYSDEQIQQIKEYEEQAMEQYHKDQRYHEQMQEQYKYDEGGNCDGFPK